MSALVLFLGLHAAAPSGLALEGQRIFNDPGLGTNGVACAQCHATVKDETRRGDGLRRAGHTLWGVARRPYWRGDRQRKLHTRLPQALNICVQLFQGGKPLEGRDQKAMVAYLKSLSKRGPRPAPVILKPALEADLDYNRPKYQGGDPERGRGLFYSACHSCHPHGRSGLGPTLRGQSLTDLVKAVREGNGLIRGARRGTAWMPAFGLDRLSHGEVADIAAYVITLPAKR